MTIINTTASNFLVQATQGVIIRDVTFINVFDESYTLWEEILIRLVTFNKVPFAQVARKICIQGRICEEGTVPLIVDGMLAGLRNDPGSIIGSCSG